MTPAADQLPRTRVTGSFERRVARALEQHVEPNAPIVVACSGGPDSLATLVAAGRSRPGSVTAAHFDHRLRPAAEVAAERALVEAVATQIGAGFLGGRAPSIPEAGEAAAREARYRWLARAGAEAGAEVCVTGHTLDDQAETVLLRLVRGTGLAGVAGMAPSSPWPVQLRGVRPPTLVRPLLAITRAEIEVYLAALGLQAAVDPSNATLDYARNRVRQRVVPELHALNPQAAQRIAAFADHARAADEALDGWAAAVLDSSATQATGAIEIDRQALLDLPTAVASRVVRQAAAHLHVALDAERVQAVLRAAHSGAHRASLGSGVEARRVGDRLVIARDEKISEKLPPNR